MQSVTYIKVMRIISIFTIIFLAAGCASSGGGGGFDAIKNTNRLSSGMRPGEVTAILGEPASTQLVADKLVWKYSLHQIWKGYVPYYLVFGRKSQKLEQWFADENEYQAHQKSMLEASQPVQPQKKSSSGSSTQSSCESKYKYFEDRMCYCHSQCNTLQ